MISLYFGGYSLCLIAEEEVSVIILVKKKWNYLYLIELVATSSINFSWQVFPNIIHYNTNKTHQMYSLFILKCNHLHLVSLDAYAWPGVTFCVLMKLNFIVLFLLNKRFV